MITETNTITFLEPIIIGLRIFAAAGLIAFVGLNIALWWTVRVN